MKHQTCAYSLLLVAISVGLSACGGGGAETGPKFSEEVVFDNQGTYYGKNPDEIRSYAIESGSSVVEGSEVLSSDAALNSLVSKNYEIESNGVQLVSPLINEANSLDYAVLRGNVVTGGEAGKCYDSRRPSPSSTMVRGMFLPCVTGKKEQLIKLIDRGQTTSGQQRYQVAINAGELCVQANGAVGSALVEGNSIIAGTCGVSDGRDIWIEHEDGTTRAALNSSLCLKSVNDQLFLVKCDPTDAMQYMGFSNFLEEVGLMYKAWGGYCLSTGTSPSDHRGTYKLAACNQYDQAQRIGAHNYTATGRKVLQGGYFGHRCMAAAGGSLALGNYLANGELCDGSHTRSWFFNEQGQLRSPDTNLCAGVEGSTPQIGARVVLQNCDGSMRQKFEEVLPHGPES